MNHPNIVFVFADQLRHSALGCYGDPVAKTPNLDSFARQGMLLENAFSSCPICSPYRAQLLSGMYAHQNGTVCNEYKMRKDIETLPLCLRKHGYHTAYVGKWHLGYGPYPSEKRYGFDWMAAYNIDDMGSPHTEYYLNEEGPFQMEKWDPYGETRIAINYIENHVAQNPSQPFCLVVSWLPPHWPYEHCPDEYNILAPADMDIPPNVPEEFIDFTRRELALYYGHVHGLDCQFGLLLQALETQGLAENTIVCFSADHGDHIGAHGYGKPYNKWLHHTKRGSKGTPYNESIHIPFILRYPGKVAAAQTNDILFNSVDVMPTLLGLCNIQAPASVTGQNLSFAFRGYAGKEPDSAFFQLLGEGWPHRGPWLGFWRAVRTKKHLYARWYQNECPPLLFNLQADPYEMKNLYFDPGSKPVLDEMEALLNRWLTEQGDPFLTGERDPVTHMLKLGQHTIAPDKYENRIELLLQDGQFLVRAVSAYNNGFAHGCGVAVTLERLDGSGNWQALPGAHWEANTLGGEACLEAFYPLAAGTYRATGSHAMWDDERKLQSSSASDVLSVQH